MKVNIGPYPKYIKKTQTYSPPERKVSVRIDPWDTWSMDHTLAHIIVPMLIQLRDTKHGAPYTDDEDVPENLHAVKMSEEDDALDTHHFTRWNWILNEMIWAFEQYLDDDAHDQFYTGKADYLWQPCDVDGNPIGEPAKHGQGKSINAAYYKMVEGPNHTLVHDEVGHRAYEARRKNGYRLFGKYYQALWD
jgi:predicted DCC family thiol-disulfide oxidoreductase YuxK